MVTEPNFDTSKGQGILATKRTDFQKHIDGTDFYQEATSVTLEPPIEISGGDKNNVREALEALAQTVVSGAPDADATTKGILKLTNDFSGTADLPQVVGIRNRPVTNAVPNVGESLLWSGSQWYYDTIAGTFTAGGDLGGTSSSQIVERVSGSGGTAIVSSDLEFSTSLSPSIYQIDTAAAGNAMAIHAQNSSASTGGSLTLSSGTAGGSNNVGDLSLRLGSIDLLQLKEASGDQSVLALCGTASGYGSSPGDKVIYINNAAANPAANPTAGALLYSNGNSLYTRRGNGLDFEIGEAQSFDGYSIFISGEPADGQVLAYNDSNSRWELISLSGSFSAGGDLSGSSSSQTVIGLQSESVSATTPTNGQVLAYNGSAWAPSSVSTFSTGGDLSGSSSSQTVIGLQTESVSATTPTVNQVLTYDGYVWEPADADNNNGNINATATVLSDIATFSDVDLSSIFTRMGVPGTGTFYLGLRMLLTGVLDVLGNTPTHISQDYVMNLTIVNGSITSASVNTTYEDAGTPPGYLAASGSTSDNPSVSGLTPSGTELTIEWNGNSEDWLSPYLPGVVIYPGAVTGV